MTARDNSHHVAAHPRRGDLWRLALIALAVFLFSAGHGNAQPGEQTPVPEQVSVTANVLNVRTGPGTDTAVARQVRQGTVLPVLGRNEAGTWLQVRTADGIVGWVSAQYVTSQASAEATPTPAATATSVAAPAPAAQAQVPAATGMTGREDRLVELRASALLAVYRLRTWWQGLARAAQARWELTLVVWFAIVLVVRLLVTAARRGRRRSAGPITAAASGLGTGHRYMPGTAAGARPVAESYARVDTDSGAEYGSSYDPDPRATERFEQEWQAREEREEAAREERRAAREEERQAWDDAAAEQAEDRRAAEIQAVSDYQAERAVEQWEYQMERAQERWDYEQEKRQEAWERQFQDDDE